jgi:hypothetical protein
MTENALNQHRRRPLHGHPEGPPKTELSCASCGYSPVNDLAARNDAEWVAAYEKWNGPTPAAPPPAPSGYLPMACPVCGRDRVMWDGKVLSCEKCTTTSETDGFSSDRYLAPVPEAAPHRPDGAHWPSCRTCDEDWPCAGVRPPEPGAPHRCYCLGGDGTCGCACHAPVPEAAPGLRDHEWCIPHEHVEVDTERWERDQAASLARARWANAESLREAVSQIADDMDDAGTRFSAGADRATHNAVRTANLASAATCGFWVARLRAALAATPPALDVLVVCPSCDGKGEQMTGYYEPEPEKCYVCNGKGRFRALLAPSTDTPE